ncbi:MAG: ABC transporter substrate-binding protein [Chloroflexi bacterium]|nr:ABC transporter substrate-binding protein [Chloroflexota bacterium]MCI0644633.1 ABC transporter substrate-binding protein [Chloroflexota bacterium]MCI0730454.1 ABC transporter substrate-binding protein [Chloroflexota bacterium]
MEKRLEVRAWRLANLQALTSLTTFFAILTLLLLGCAADSESWDRIQAAGVLRVGLDPTYPPFETAEGDELYGLDIDLARAVAVDLGLQAEFVYFGYDGLYDALATGQVDVLISALVVAPERTRDFAYSRSYFNAGELLVAAADSPIREMANMAGRTLAVELGAQGHVEATNWERRLPNLAVVPYNTAEEALAAVSAGQADAALVDSVSGRLFLQETSHLHVAIPAVTEEPFAFVVRIDDVVLLEKLDESLGRLEASGRLDEIVGYWLGR